MSSRPTRLPSLLLLMTVLLGACGERTALEAAFFYDEYCPSCEDYKRAEDLAGRLLWITRSGGGLKTEAHNLIIPESIEHWTGYVEQHGFPDIRGSVPVLFVGDLYFVGYDDVEREISRLESEVPRSGLRKLLTRPRRAEF